jgi:hypothetical protein
MQKRMTMAPDRERQLLRRRPDGLVQIQAIPLPSFSLGTMRTLGFGAVGVALLVAALVAAPFWMAFGGRHLNQGRSGARASQGATLSDLHR